MELTPALPRQPKPRRDIVAERVRELVAHFARFASAYDDLVPFTPDQLAAHRATIALRRSAGSAAAALNDSRFIASLRDTLVAWGLDRRASRLVSHRDFEAALRRALPDIAALETLSIDASLPDSVPESLWNLIESLGIVANDAKIVAGTKTVHHVLPDLMPPMDRVWTGMFFGLHAPEWQGAGQRVTFRRMYRTFHDIAQRVNPRQYVTGEGWRTSQTKVLENAIIGYCKTTIGREVEDQARGDRRISLSVAGYPPAKNEALSMLGERHPHRPRVLALLQAAKSALYDHPTFVPGTDQPLALEVTLVRTPDHDPWDATNYLGGIADVLENKARRGANVAHLGELAGVHLYQDDRQIREVSYREELGTTAQYTVMIRQI